MSGSKFIAIGFIGAILLLIAAPAGLRAQESAASQGVQEPDGRSLMERSIGWDSYLRQEGDYKSAVYEVALPSANSLTPNSLVVGRPHSNCDSPTVTYYVAPAAKEEVDQGNLKGGLKVDEQSFEVTYRVVSTGDGVFTIHFTSFGPDLITALLNGASAEISLPNVGDFTATVPLAGFAQAWERAGRLCVSGEGIKLF